MPPERFGALMSGIVGAPVDFQEWRATDTAKQLVHDMWVRVDKAVAAKAWPPE